MTSRLPWCLWSPSITQVACGEQRLVTRKLSVANLSSAISCVILDKLPCFSEPQIKDAGDNKGFPGGISANAGDIRRGFNPWVGKNPLEEGMATRSNVLAWRIPWTEEPGGLQTIGLQITGHDWSNLAHTQGRWEPYFTDKLLWDSSVQETYVPFLQFFFNWRIVDI